MNQTLQLEVDENKEKIDEIEEIIEALLETRNESGKYQFTKMRCYKYYNYIVVLLNFNIFVNKNEHQINILVLKQEGEDCGVCFCPPTYFAGNCAPGLECQRIRRGRFLPDATRRCVRPGKLNITDSKYLNVYIFFG